MVFSSYIMIWGTSFALTAGEFQNHEQDLTPTQIHHLEIGSKLNVPSRIMLVGALWSLKFVIFDFLWRIIRKLPYERPILITYVTIIVATWIASNVVVLAECRPFHRWWQLSPNPGPCVQANQWLITYEVGNMVTDAMLLALPFPLLFMARVPLEKRIRLIALFSIGFFLLAICIVRMVQGLQHAHFQLSRTMWASIELLFATIVACSPSIYCHIRRGRESTGITNMMPTTQRGSNSSARTECRMGKSTSHGSGNSYSIENGRSSFPGNIGGSTTSFTGGETRHSSIFSNYRNSERHGSCAGSRRNSSRNPSIASRHSIISRNFSVSSSRNMSFSSSRHSNTAAGASKSRMGSYAGPNFDIPTYDGEIFPGFDAFGGHERGSVSASVWTYGGVMEEGKTEGDGGKEEKGGFYVIDEEEGKGLEGIMVDTTWSQVSEVDTECRPGASGIIQPPSRTITEEEEPEESGL
ncbi:hypothetical protein TWF970_007644 [Orbilia oligospora]|uniref:Rhodopsin domain-containing protein n=1 Tax=Orbilia oligospora TaxID=2813651 RepID=A0A7C8VDP5_ORBOL|nr:hypothetical protein TWF970_007644 [Orbilia oligospora]